MNLIGVPVGDPDPSYAPLNRDELAAMANVLKFTVLADRLAVKVPAGVVAGVPCTSAWSAPLGPDRLRFVI